MKNLNEINKPQRPVKVLQFGEGGFLRGFVDWMLQKLNDAKLWNGSVVVAQPIEQGLCDMLDAQNGIYTHIIRGAEGVETSLIDVIDSCVKPYEDFDAYLKLAENPELRFIVSNTTEAGITFDNSCSFNDEPPAYFPAKLTALLYERYKTGLKGFIILSCELIDNNGAELKKCVMEYIKLWKLENDFAAWVDKENLFCSTLVDRIVTGYPRSEAADICKSLGYEDNLIDTGEVFGFWVIEGPDSLKEELPFHKAGLPVLVTDDHTPYKKRKVRILNGAHTSMVLGAYLAGQDIVRNCMEDSDILGFLKKTVYDEIIPTLDLPNSELTDFAAATVERFNNHYIDHSLLAISLNSTSKWKARVMPSLLEYVNRKGELPRCITFSFAAYIAFYTSKIRKDGNSLYGTRGTDSYEIKDDQWILDFYFAHKDDSPEQLAHAVIHNELMWGNALKNLKGFEEAVSEYLLLIDKVGMRNAIKECI